MNFTMISSANRVRKSSPFFFVWLPVALSFFVIVAYVIYTPQFVSYLQFPEIVSRSLRESSDLKVHDLPVYFINLDADSSRRSYIKEQLKAKGFTDINHVSAWTPSDVSSRVQLGVTSVQNMLKQNDKEIACIASHLYAIYQAVTDITNDSPYALIMEDDIRFEFDINWEDMIAAAPSDFGILQLTSSNSEKVGALWKEYLEEIKKPASSLRGSSNPQWVHRNWDSMLWSTQAYLIRKDAVRSLIEPIIKLNPSDHKYHMHIPKPPHGFVCGSASVCILPFRIVADIYLYSYFAPSYMTRIPMFNGIIKNTQEIKETSQIQEESKVEQHLKKFQETDVLIHELKANYESLLPAYLQL
jgi:GR25 family glycosyltransferase involved in LPS biosynthesis